MVYAVLTDSSDGSLLVLEESFLVPCKKDVNKCRVCKGLLRCHSVKGKNCLFERDMTYLIIPSSDKKLSCWPVKRRPPVACFSPPWISRDHFFLAVFVRIPRDGQSEGGTTDW